MVNDLLTDRIKVNYEQVVGRVQEAARRVGRGQEQIQIVVVTKTHPVEVLAAAVKAGVNKFGENYAEEAIEKMDRLGEVPGLEWHMIGHIQSRKAELVSQNFHLVHSLDSLKIAARLDRFAGQKGRILPVFLECNASGENTKYGWRIDQKSQWDAVIAEFEQILDFPNLRVRGLMSMPPYSTSPEDARPYFKILKEFQQELSRRLSASEWKELSMGMSGDYEVAVEEGATFVRIGTAILGARIQKKDERG
jgi:PLP dependent protein